MGCPREIGTTNRCVRVVNCELEKTMAIENLSGFGKGFCEIPWNASVVSMTRKDSPKSVEKRMARSRKLGSLGQLLLPYECELEHGAWLCSLC